MDGVQKGSTQIHGIILSIAALVLTILGTFPLTYNRHDDRQTGPVRTLCEPPVGIEGIDKLLRANRSPSPPG